jgi:translocation and assembly module TamA
VEAAAVRSRAERSLLIGVGRVAVVLMTGVSVPAWAQSGAPSVSVEAPAAAPEALPESSSNPSRPTPHPLSGLPFIGHWFGEPAPREGEDASRASPRYALEIEAPEPIARLVREHTLLGRWRQRADFDPTQLPLFIARGPAEVTALLAAEGYFSAQVSVTAIEGGARVRVLPGPRTTVSAVHLDLQGELAQAGHEAVRAGIERRWRLPLGQPFRSADWDDAKRGLIDALHDRGYLRAALLESEAEVDAERAAVELRVKVDSGAPVRFGELQINGLKRYPAAVIEGLKAFKQGDPYDVRQVVDLQTRLNGAGWFTTVSVQPDLRALLDAPDLQEVPLRVEVIERQAKRWTLGGGYDAENGFNVLAGWENRNVLGIGLQSLNGLEIDQRRQLLFSTWDAPQDTSGYRWQGSLRLEHRDIQNELTQSGSISVARLHRQGKIESGLSLQYQTEIQNIVYSSTLQDDLRNRALVLGWSWTRRDFDSPLAPSRGTLATVQVSGATEALGSDRSFARVYGMVYGLMPLTRADGTDHARIVLRAELGAVQAESREGIPSVNLFRTGGGRSVRGYNTQSLGVTLGEATVGGRFLAVGSAEYQHLLNRTLALAGFVDVGNAADSLRDLKPKVGVGVGVRWFTPVGPLNADLAWGLDPGQWRFYVSIGVLF